MKANRVFLFALFSIFCISGLFAQEKTEFRQKRPKLPELQQPQKKSRMDLGISPEAVALEHAVDPQTYIVGPGDKFFITIPNYLQEGFQTAVTAEGKLIIPTLGNFVVAGKLLAVVQDDIQKAGKKKYLQGKVQANLIALRYFRVHVLGEVTNPGIYALRQTYRVSDALALAGGLSDWANLNAIEIRRNGEPVRKIDLTDYTAHGNLQQNPQVLDGDVIYVPRVQGDVVIIRVQGRIQNPGFYFARPNETADAFLNRLSGATRKEDLVASVIKRPIPGKDEYAVLPLFNRSADGLADDPGSPDKLVLQNGDILSIPSIKDSVYVQGAVWHPGAYPYYPNFLARDYAGLAGPNENAAGMQSLRVRHAEGRRTEKGPDVAVKPGDTIEVKIAKRILVKDYMQIAVTILGQVFSFLTLREVLKRK